MENYTICNCKNVTYFDVAEALHNCPTFSDVERRLMKYKKSPTALLDAVDVTERS
mgnify:CR=1 FL=1